MEDYELQRIVMPLLKWYRKNARNLPWRRNTDAYRVWVSEIMLQQTRVEAVIPYYERFMQRFPDIQALAQGSEEELLKLWEGLGYYSRARNLHKAAVKICEEYQGQFPFAYQEILSLPGIGEYTAGAVSSIAFEQQQAAVDGNVLRVITRVTRDSSDILDTKFKKKVTERLRAVYPQGACGDFTQSLMELGAVVCVPNGVPRCAVCPLQKLCGACETQTQMEYPVRRKKPVRKVEQKTVLLLQYKDRIALRKRERGGLLGGMWELPNLDGKKSRKEIAEWLAGQGVAVKQITKGAAKKHIFTHIEWHMESFAVECGEVCAENPFVWITPEELEQEYALPTAFKKIYD